MRPPVFPLLIEQLFSAGFFALGLLVLYGAVIQRRKRRLVEDIPTSKVRSVAVGPVEVSGEPVPRDGTLEAPFSDEECIAYVYSVDRYHEGGKNSSGGWRPAEAGVKFPPFYVDDGTGRILVDPEGAEKDLSAGNEYTYSDDEEETDEVKGFMSERDALFEESAEDEDGFGGIASSISDMAEIATSSDARIGDASRLVGSDERRRYQENYLPVDEDVYVFGRAEIRDGVESADNPENLVITRNEETPLFKISDKSEPEVVSDAGSSQKAGMAFGFIFAVVGFGATLYTAGPFYGVALLGLAAYGAYRFNERFTMKRDPDEERATQTDDVRDG